MVKCHIGYTWQKDELVSLHGIIEFSNVAIYWREEEQTASWIGQWTLQINKTAKPLGMRETQIYPWEFLVVF